MSSLDKTPRRPSTSSSKLDFIKSLRRLTSKSEHEPVTTDPEEYIPSPTRISSLTAESVTRALHSASTSSPPRRVRMSGSRLPSGYRSSVSPKPIPQPVPNPPMEPQPNSSVTHKGSPPPFRTRIARLIPGHTARSASVSTSTSSTLSFPSSRASTSTTASSLKTVRFSPDTSFVRATRQRSEAHSKLEQREKVSRWGKRPNIIQGRDGTTEIEA